MTTDTELPPTPLQVAVVTLGCARNEVDSEELAGRLEAGGFVLVADPEDADTVVHTGHGEDTTIGQERQHF